MKIHIVIVITLLIVVAFQQDDDGTDPARDVLTFLQLGETADTGLGMVTDAVLVRTIAWLPRGSVWSMQSMTGGLWYDVPHDLDLNSIDVERITNSINSYVLGQNDSTHVFEEPPAALVDAVDAAIQGAQVNDLSSFDPIVGSMQDLLSWGVGQLLLDDSIPNYFFGVIGTMWYGIIPLIITWFWSWVLFFTCCYCFWRCCCCPNARLHEQEKLKKLDFARWQAQYLKRKAFQKCLRIFIFVFSSVVFVLFLIWGLLVFQSSLGMSNSIDRSNDDFDTIKDYAEKFTEAPEDIGRVMDMVGRQVDSTVEMVLDIIPVDFDDVTACIDEIFANALPDIAVFEGYFNMFNDVIGSLGNISSFSELSQNISVFMDSFETIMNDAEMKLMDLEADLDQTVGEIGVLKQSFVDLEGTSMTDNEQLTAVSEALDILITEKNGNLNSNFLTGLNDKCLNPDNYVGSEVVADLKQLSAAIAELSKINTTELNATLNGFAGFPEIQAILDGMDTAVNNLFDSQDALSVKMDDLLLLLDDFNSTVDDICDFVDGLNSTLQSFQTDIMDLIPSFDPILDELTKIMNNDTFACIDSLLEKVWEFNRTILTFPENITNLILEFTDVQSMLFGDGGMMGNFSFDDLLGPLDGIEDIIGGQLQTVFEDVLTFSSDDIRAMIPSFGFDTTMLDDIQSQFSALNKTEILGILGDANTTLQTTLSFFDNDYSSVIMEIDNLVALNSTVANYTQVFVFLNDSSCVVPDCPATGDFSATIIQANSTLHQGGDSLETLQSDLLTLNDSIDLMPDTASYIDMLNTANDSISAFNFGSILAAIHEANDTVLDSLPFGDLGDLVSGLEDQITGGFGFNMSDLAGMFDDFAGIYESFNLTDMLGDILNINGLVEEYLGFIPEYIAMGKDYVKMVNNVTEPMYVILDALADLKDSTLDGYVYKLDGYRLIFALICILLFIPLPPLGIFATCCYKRPCCLVLISLWLIFFSGWFWVMSIVGYPVSIFMNDGCEKLTNTINQAIDIGGVAIGDLALDSVIPGEALPYFNQSTISELVLNGITDDYVNNLINVELKDVLVDLILPLIGLNSTAPLEMGELGQYDIGPVIDTALDKMNLDLEFDPIRIQNLINTYLDYEQRCQLPDIVQIGRQLLNTSTENLIDVGLDIAMAIELPMGFRFAEKFPDLVLQIVDPVIGNISVITDIVEEYFGCSELTNLYDIAYNAICNVGRYSFSFLWGILAIGALMLLIVTVVNCIVYCCLEHNYTRDFDDKKGGVLLQVEEDSDSDVEAYPRNSVVEMKDNIAPPNIQQFQKQPVQPVMQKPLLMEEKVQPVLVNVKVQPMSMDMKSEEQLKKEKGFADVELEDRQMAITPLDLDEVNMMKSDAEMKKDAEKEKAFEDIELLDHKPEMSLDLDDMDV